MLDFHGNNCRRPQTVVLGDTIFDEQQQTVSATMTPELATATAAMTGFLPGQLRDSDGSDGDVAAPVYCTGGWGTTRHRAEENARRGGYGHRGAELVEDAIALVHG